MQKFQYSPFYFFSLLFLFGIFGITSSFSEDLLKLETKAQKLWKQGKYYESSLCYETLLQKNPEKIDYYVLLTQLYRYLYLPKKMKQILEQGLQIDPENTSLLLEKARYLLFQEKPDEALSLLLRLAEKNKDYALMTELAEAYIDKKEEKRARYWIDQASLVSEDQPKTYQLWAKFFF